MEGRPGETMEPLDFEALKRELAVQFPNIKDQDVMSVAMYPHVAKEFLKYRGELESSKNTFWLSKILVTT